MMTIIKCRESRLNIVVLVWTRVVVNIIRIFSFKKITLSKTPSDQTVRGDAVFGNVHHFLSHCSQLLFSHCLIIFDSNVNCPCLTMYKNGRHCLLLMPDTETFKFFRVCLQSLWMLSSHATCFCLYTFFGISKF